MNKKIEEIKKLLIKGQVELTLDKMSQLHSFTKKDEFIAISHQYNHLKAQYVKNLVSIEEYNRGLARIIDSLLQILAAIKETPTKIEEKNKQAQVNNIPLSYTELEDRITAFCQGTEQSDFEELLKITKLVIQYGVSHFNANNFSDCNDMYLFFIKKIKEHALEFIKYRIDTESVCRTYIFDAFSAFEIADEVKNERKFGRQLRSVIDTILDCEAYAKSIEEFDEAIVKNRDTHTALYGETVVDLIDIALEMMMNFQKSGSAMLAYHLSINYLSTLSDYFRKQKFWLNRSQKRISISISDDIIDLYKSGLKIEKETYANFIMEFNELMSDIMGMMEMNLEFYQDEQKNNIGL